MISQRCFALALGLTLATSPALAADKKEKKDEAKSITDVKAAAADAGKAKITSSCFFDITIGGKPSGQIVVGVYGDVVPKTAANFMAICKGEKGLNYANSPFHRVIPGFMLQGGDITAGNGTGGKSIYGDKFEDEKKGLELKHTKPGTLSMANAGPNTNGSQFFITVAPTPWLDGRHVVFGEVTSGMDLVTKIEALGSQSGETKAKVMIAKSGEKK